MCYRLCNYPKKFRMTENTEYIPRSPISPRSSAPAGSPPGSPRSIIPQNNEELATCIDTIKPISGIIKQCLAGITMLITLVSLLLVFLYEGPGAALVLIRNSTVFPTAAAMLQMTLIDNSSF